MATRQNVSREALYEEVWAAPLIEVAARYAISDVMLAKVCKRLRVPHPGRGYWRRLEVGQKPPKRPPLPPSAPGDVIEWARDGMPAARAPLPPPMVPGPDAPPKKRYARKGRHPLLVGVDDDFSKNHVDSNEYRRPHKFKLPDIHILKEGSVTRAIEVANKLYRALEARGLRVELGRHGYARPRLSMTCSSKYRDSPHEVEFYARAPTVVLVRTLAIGIIIYEQAELVPGQRDYKTNTTKRTDTDTPDFRRRELFNQYIGTVAVPSGRFGVWLYSPYDGVDWRKNFVEQRAGQLGGHLGKSIAAELVAQAPSLAARARAEEERRNELHRQWLERQREDEEREAAREAAEHAARLDRERRAAAELRERIEQASRAELVAIVEDWFVRERVAAFVDALETSVAVADEAQQTALRERLTRLKEVLAQHDPVARLLAWRTPAERLTQRDSEEQRG